MTSGSSDHRSELPAFRALAELPSDAVRALLARAEPRTWDAGESIVRQGEHDRWMLFLVSGAAHAAVSGADGRRVVVGHFGPGDVLGEMAILTRQPRTADVVADTTVTGLVVGADAFDELASEFAELGGVLTNVVAERLGLADTDGLSGKVVDRYRIRRCVGRGGMAIVYDAEDVETGERVALKMMSHRLIFHPGAMQRFQRESELTTGLSHPSLLRVRSRFRAYRTFFLVMDFCDGPSLDRWISKGPRTTAVARAIAGQLGGALAHLHANGVVHRDLKPSNVIVVQGGLLKLTDFGLAKATLVQPVTSLTQEGALLGTPYYMPPEAFEGAESGREADVYGLGCVVLESLLGRPVFRESSIAELHAAKRGYTVPDLPEFDGESGRELSAFLALALDPNPARRTVDLAQIERWSAPLP